MFHPYAQIYGFVKEPTDSNRAPPTCSWSKEFYDDRSVARLVRGYGIQFGRGVARSKPSRASRRAFCHGARITTGLPPAQRSSPRSLRDLRGSARGTHNRVTLDPVLKDCHGIFAPKIDYTISENSRKMMNHGLARGREIPAAGATDICTNEPIPWGGWHLLGTARMGTDPRDPLSTNGGRLHDVKNLFIVVDGSVFVAFGRRQPDLHHSSHRALHRRPDEEPPCQSI